MLGHDVLTTLDSGQAGQAIHHESVLQFTASQGRILITLNRKHFIRLHLSNAQHSGIIVCTFNPNFIQPGRNIHELILKSGELKNTLLRVYRENDV